MKQKEWIWVVLLLMGVPILFFHESLFTDKVLSQADVLLSLSPWHFLAPPNFLPSNWLLMDQTFQFFPWLSFARDEIQKGTLPLWNPYSYSGSPLFANGQAAIFSPFHLLFYLFPFLKMFAVSACLRFFLAALFMYLFVRSLGTGHLGGILAAIGYQSCGFMMCWLNHPHSNPAALLPLLFWLTERVCQKPSPRRASLLALALFLQFLSGHIPTAFVQILVVLGYGIYRSKGSFKTFRCLLLATFLGACLTAFLLFPTLEYARVSHARTYRFVAHSPFPQAEDLKAMLVIFFPMLYGTPLRQNDTGLRNFNELNGGFVGFVILAFALIALFGKIKGRQIRFFFALMLIGFGAAYHLPILATFLDKTALIRIFRPDRWLLFSAFSLSVLAGFGFDQLLSFKKEKFLLFRRILLTLIVVVGSCGVWIALMREYFLPEVSPTMLLLSLSSSLGILGVLFFLSMMWSRSLLRVSLFQGGIFLLVILEHFLFGFRYNPTLKPKDLFPVTPGIQYLLSDRDPNPFRILSLSRVLYPNTHMMYHLQDVRGYDAMEYEPYMHYLEKIGPPKFSNPFFKLIYFSYYDSPLIDLLNVKYFLSSAKPLSGDFLRLAYDGEMAIYQNLRQFPRAHLFTDYEVIPDPEAQLDRLVKIKTSEALKKTVFLKEPPPLLGEVAKDWKIRWLSYEPNHFSLHVTLDGSGILFLSEVDYPGWKAYVDGKRVKILRANYLFRSILLPQGTHHVEMKYEPESFRWGVGVSVVPLVCITFLFLFL